MKHPVQLYFMVIVLAAAGLIFACEQAPKGDKAIIGEQASATEGVGETFVVDTARSWIRFTGHGVGKNPPRHFQVEIRQCDGSGQQDHRRYFYHGHHVP